MLELYVDDPLHLVAAEPIEEDDFIEAVEEFRPERPPHHLHDLLARGFGRLAFEQRGKIFGPEVRREHDDGILEIYGVALAVGQPAVVEDLQQDVEDVVVRLLDLVEENDLIRPATYGLGERATFLVPDIAGRSADQSRDGMLLHEFRHVDAHHGVLVVEQKFRERLAQLGFSDAGRAQEQERADRAVRILQARSRAPYRARYRVDGLLLAYHALAKLLLHVKELFALAFQHPVDGNPGPA